MSITVLEKKCQITHFLTGKRTSYGHEHQWALAAYTREGRRGTFHQLICLIIYFATLYYDWNCLARECRVDSTGWSRSGWGRCWILVWKDWKVFVRYGVKPRKDACMLSRIICSYQLVIKVRVKNDLLFIPCTRNWIPFKVRWSVGLIRYELIRCCIIIHFYSMQ